MIVDIRRPLAVSIPEKLERALRVHVTKALQSIRTDRSRFTVNPTKWRNVVKMTHCVMNAANYISSAFQHSLREDFGWETNCTVAEQQIDGYKEFRFPGQACYLDSAGYKELLNRHWDHALKDAHNQFFLDTYQCYFQRRLFGVPRWAGRDSELFLADSSSSSLRFRVGVEFETGNIASAFRAFSKLDTLFRLGHIDLAVFVTTDRKSSTQIWPASNRNVSYEELENRNYRSNVNLPMWEFLFKPDSFSRTAPYFNSAGELFGVEPTTKKVTFEGKKYPVFRTTELKPREVFQA